MRSCIYLAPLLLYYPRFLPNIETQPTIALVMALAGLFFGKNRRAGLAFSILASILIFWIVLKVSLENNLGGSIGLFQILIGPLILFGLLALQAPPPSRNLMAGVAIYFLICAIVEIFASDVYVFIASMLLDRFNVFDGHRGISLLTPEPTYAAISGIYFLMLAWWSGRCWGFRFGWIEPVLVLCLLATGSTFVLILLLAIAYVQWPRFMLLATASISVFLFLIDVVALDNDDSIRAVVAISRLFSVEFNEFLPSISVLDASLGSRLATQVASFLTLYHSPFGLGLDCAAVPTAYVASGFDFAFDNLVLSEVLEYGCIKPQSYAAAVALGLGVFSIVFLILLVALIRYSQLHKNSEIWIHPFALSIVMLILQGQLSNPIPWLLIFLALTGYPGHPWSRHLRTMVKTNIFHSSK